VTNKYTVPNKILFSVSVLVALMLATGTVAALIAQPAAAQDTLIPTTTHQAQTCDTAGSASSISISCNGTFNNNVANSPNPKSCPTGFTPSQGLCVAPVTYVCPTGTAFAGTFSLVGTTCRSITNHLPEVVTFILSNVCKSLQGQVTIINPNSIQCDVPATATCPGGITPTNGQCITKPS
jgi:hypothetical protein